MAQLARPQRAESSSKVRRAVLAAAELAAYGSRGALTLAHGGAPGSSGRARAAWAPQRRPGASPRRRPKSPIPPPLAILGVPLEEGSIATSSHSLSVRAMRAATLPDAVGRVDPLDFADVLLRTDSDLSAIRDYEAEVEAEKESERRSIEWDESMRTLDSLQDELVDSEQLKKTKSRIGSLMNGAI